MWKKVFTFALSGLLASCGPEGVSAQDTQINETSYKNTIDVSEIIKLDDFFNGDGRLYNKLNTSNDEKSNYITINGIGELKLYKQNHHDGSDKYTSIIVPLEAVWNGLHISRLEWAESSNKMWGYFYLYFDATPSLLSRTVNSVIDNKKIQICSDETLSYQECGCPGYTDQECGKKLYPNMPINMPLVEINIINDSNDSEGSILSFRWSS